MNRLIKNELLLCALISLLVHVTVLIVTGGSYDFTCPVQPQAVMELQVDAKVERDPRQNPPKGGRTSPHAVPATTTTLQKPVPDVAGDSPGKAEEEGKGPDQDTEDIGAVPAAKPATVKKEDAAPARSVPLAEAMGGADASKPATTLPVAVDLAAVQQWKRVELWSTGREKLTYRMSFLGVPVGGALLEARKEGETVLITSTIRSNPLAGGIFRVDDSAESRIIAGRYIISTIRQQEGDYRSDTGFTLCLQERKVFWMDRLHKLSVTEPLLDDQATDILSALYLLRKEPLQVGKSVELHVFDSNRSVVVPVHVLRKERVKLQGAGEVPTLVVRPALQEKGVFRRTGDVLIWLTDDAYKVPVRLETTLAVGNVTAELVSAEADLDTGHGAKPRPAVLSAR